MLQYSGILGSNHKAHVSKNRVWLDRESVNRAGQGAGGRWVSIEERLARPLRVATWRPLVVRRGTVVIGAGGRWEKEPRMKEKESASDHRGNFRWTGCTASTSLQSCSKKFKCWFLKKKKLTLSYYFLNYLMLDFKYSLSFIYRFFLIRHSIWQYILLNLFLNLLGIEFYNFLF